MKVRDYTVKCLIESYGSYYINYNGEESKHVCPMTYKQAKFLASKWGGYVVALDPLDSNLGHGVYLS